MTATKEIYMAMMDALKNKLDTHPKLKGNVRKNKKGKIKYPLAVVMPGPIQNLLASYKKHSLRASFSVFIVIHNEDLLEGFTEVVDIGFDVYDYLIADRKLGGDVSIMIIETLDPGYDPLGLIGSISEHWMSLSILLDKIFVGD